MKPAGPPKSLDQRIHSAFEWTLARLPVGLGRRLRKATGGRFGIGSQIVVGLGGGVVLTLCASVLALGLMTILGNRQEEITDDHMPALVSAFAVARSTSELVQASPELVAVGTSEDLETVWQEVQAVEERLGQQVAGITRQGRLTSAAVPQLRLLLERTEEIRRSVDRRLDFGARLAVLDDEIESVDLSIANSLEGELDDQEFFIDTGLRELAGQVVPLGARTTQAELDRHRALMDLNAAQRAVVTVMFQALSEEDATQLRANQERFNTAFSQMETGLGEVRPALAEVLRPRVETLRALYDGTADGVLTTRRLWLEEVANSQNLLEQNRRTSAELVGQVNELVQAGENATRNAAAASSGLVRLGWWVILTVNVAAVAAAILVGWKFFGERLLVRIRHLSDSMRSMSQGDLKVRVEIAGDDEVTDMAADLEVFRKHALEVQRLNLVEKLAGEVQAKNEALEKTLDDLRRTQQQVAQQEKLASLGALTAGIAHEIRNPLNFVNNFAALSTELLEELKEELADDENGELDRKYVEEILGDLSLNVSKVKEHGGRANRIVDGMLAHSRDEAGKPESVDVNQVLDEYAKLAYHGLRASDPMFNVTIDRVFDPEAGEVTAIARDLSRVFLNVITNACQATEIRRKRTQDEDYSPTVTLTTESSGDAVVVKVRDNGTGIPDSAVEKIFDPFFTTKSGTQGTGLGLSISHEIIQEHGGQLKVDTKEGEFTEFTVTVPRTMPGA